MSWHFSGNPYISPTRPRIKRLPEKRKVAKFRQHSRGFSASASAKRWEAALSDSVYSVECVM
jgi:hypothetical protein